MNECIMCGYEFNRGLFAGVGRGLSMAVQISTMPPLALKYNVEAIREEALAIDRALLEETRKEIERLKDELTRECHLSAEDKTERMFILSI